MGYYTGNDLVQTVYELHICGCGCPDIVYKLIHKIMKDIASRNIKTDDEEGYYDFILHQLNHMEFLEHGSSIYSSWVTEKGKNLIKALDEMAKYNYEWEEFFNNNLVFVEA